MRIIFQNVERVVANLKKKMKKIESETGNSVQKWTDYGQTYARSIAPFRTGRLVTAISQTKGGNKGHPQGVIYVKELAYPLAGYKKRWDAGRLAYEMHTRTNSRDYWNRDPYFMFTTFRMLEQKVPEDVRARINQSL